MAQKRSPKKRRFVPKTVLRLPEHDQAKAAVLPSLSSADAQRGYRHAIAEFIEWYCSEPRLSFNKTVVLRYRIYRESRKLAPGPVNLRLGAVRRLAYEAADCGLLSADLAAGIRHVKGVKKRGTTRKLVDGGTGPSAAPSAGLGALKRQAGSNDPGGPAGLWLAPARSRGTQAFTPATTGRALGDCGSSLVTGKLDGA
jgi:hypothetical protein